MIWTEKRQDTPRRGVAAVEFAVALPILLILIVGVWEVGRMIEVKQVLQNAAREGGRQASRGDRTNAQVIDSVKNYLKIYGLNITNVTVEVGVVDSSGNLDTSKNMENKDQVPQLTPIRVIVRIPWDDVKWDTLGFFTPANNPATGRPEIMGQADWRSMRDVPVEVSSTIPIPD